MAKCEKRLRKDGKLDVDEAIVLHLSFLESELLLRTLYRVLDLKGLFTSDREDPHVAPIIDAIDSAEVIEVDVLIPS